MMFEVKFWPFFVFGVEMSWAKCSTTYWHLGFNIGRSKKTSRFFKAQARMRDGKGLG